MKWKGERGRGMERGGVVSGERCDVERRWKWIERGDGERWGNGREKGGEGG